MLDRARELGLPVDVLPTAGRFDLHLLRGLYRLVREHDIRLVHAHLFSPAVYASAVRLLAGVPVVATFHGLSDAAASGFGGRLRYRLIERNAAAVAVSEPLADALGRAGLERDRVHVIHNGVDTGAFASGDRAAVRDELGVAEGSILVGSLGNLRAAKDYANLIRAAALLAHDPRFRFAIVGERSEPLYSELLELRDELGLTDRFHFWGFREDVPDVMAAFDVLVISSSTEGFSLAAVQGMAAGTPVVATRSGGPERIITDGADGLLVPPGNPVALAEAIARIADDRDLRTSVVECARRTVASRFSLSAMLDRYEELYGEAALR